jgi:hypothetical protein
MLIKFLNFGHLQIHWEERLSGRKYHGNAFAVIDGTVCPLQVPNQWELQKPWFSPKHGIHCIKYEIAVRISDGQIVWVAGGVWGSVHDLTLVRNTGLLERLVPGERIYGDKGYIGHHRIWCPYKGRTDNLTYDQICWNRYLNPLRTRVENSLNRIHKFNVLNYPWRGELHTHLDVFRVCAQIAAVDIKFNPVLW